MSASAQATGSNQPTLSGFSYRADLSLIRHACVMTLLGLFSGFTPLFARAPRIALGAHSIGLMQGAMLFGLAAIWPSLGGSARLRRAVRYTALIGFYANWLGSQLAGLWSARAMAMVHRSSMPPGATLWMEGIVAVLLNMSFLIIAMCVLILVAAREPSSAGVE
jgi:hypothetical protein